MDKVNRRRFLVAGAASSASVGMVLGSNALAQTQSTPTAQSSPPALAQNNPGFEFFTPFQAEIVASAAARLIPTDANGPGATEAGVVYFIDRQLSADYG